MTVDPVLALVALLGAVAVVLAGRFVGRRSPGPLCRPDPLTARGACPARCPRLYRTHEKGHR